MEYTVKPVVCDYGVYENTQIGNRLITICNSLSNAELVADILNEDLRNKKYEVISKVKIDKAIEEIIKLRKHYYNDDYYDCKHEVLEILKKNIG